MERINHNLTESLFELNALLAMCDLEQHITVTAYYEDYCVREVMSNECCCPWSLPNYVALLANRTHCYDLNAEDVAYVQSLLTGCFQYYHNLRLDSDCVNFRCKNVPAECAQYNAVYNIFHFLADNQFMAVNVSPVGRYVPPTHSSKNNNNSVSLSGLDAVPAPGGGLCAAGQEHEDIAVLPQSAGVSTGVGGSSRDEMWLLSGLLGYLLLLVMLLRLECGW